MYLLMVSEVSRFIDFRLISYLSKNDVLLADTQWFLKRNYYTKYSNKMPVSPIKTKLRRPCQACISKQFSNSTCRGRTINTSLQNSLHSLVGRFD